MRHRIASLFLALTVTAFPVAAQEVATARSTAQPPEVRILESAISAISTMHMESYNDSTLWAAAIRGVLASLGDSAAAVVEPVEPVVTGPANARRLVSAIREVADRKADDEANDSTLWEAAIDGVISALRDPYAELFTPEESAAWEEETTGNYSGIGLQITPLNEQVTVTAVFRSTPADQVGILVGDVIVGVNEHDASGWTTDMAADSIRGPVGTDVEVRIQRAGYDEPISFDITRAQVHVPAVQYGILESDIGYVVLDRVARNAAREMNEALAELASTRGLIIDLRRNPGGFLDESLYLADLFLKPGSTLASTVQRVPGATASTTESDSFRDRWPQLVPDLPMVILVDRFTASGAEILAGALQDFDRAIVIGERSFGKGVVQTVMDLPLNRRLRFTTGSWHTPLGRSLQRARDSYGRPIEEDLDTFPRVTTPAGRTLVNGGGIFPDLEVADDTLTMLERELVREVNEKQVPLGLRLAEISFEAAKERLAAGEPAGITDAEFERFMKGLESEGISAEMLADPEIRSYLHWRARMNVALRMDDIGAEADFRMERDPVLSEAVRLIGSTTSQAGLYRALDAAGSQRGSPGGS